MLHILSTPRGVSALLGNGHAAARWAGVMPRNRICRSKQASCGAARIARRRAHAKPMHFPWASGVRRIWHLCFCAPRGSSPQRKRLAQMHGALCTLSQNGYGHSFDGTERDSTTTWHWLLFRPARSSLSSAPILLRRSCLLGRPSAPFPRLTKLTGRALQRRRQLVSTGRGGEGACQAVVAERFVPPGCPRVQGAERRAQSRRPLSDNLLTRCAKH